MITRGGVGPSHVTPPDILLLRGEHQIQPPPRGEVEKCRAFFGWGATEAHPHPKIRCANLLASAQGGGRLSEYAIASGRGVGA
jgi:hypothetical protein